MYDHSYTDENLPGPFFTLFIIIFCIVVGFLDLGNKWYEILLRITAFLFALGIGFNIYVNITNMIVKSASPLKGLYHFVMIPISPLIIYLLLKIYLL